ncbi:MAG: hypothetical protein CMC96_08030 [Flavobacteriales bacterium]|jgi:hypothetical protein|nr:hypothetical protein [Flavobacteriales bacterium]|tara:strand:+ start:47782 stop:48318 length:537 start_codon:yes stop_codon:yes gene_type:complete
MRKYKVPFYIKVLDVYLKVPILIDLIVTAAILWGVYLMQQKALLTIFDNAVMKSLNSDLISTSISLAGFVLAALTIIVTFKDSVNSREDSNSGRDLFFKSKAYYPTVKVFYRASLVLLFIFLTLSLCKITEGQYPAKVYNFIVIANLCLIVTTVLRSLYLLLKIIKLQDKANQQGKAG